MTDKTNGSITARAVFRLCSTPPIRGACGTKPKLNPAFRFYGYVSRADRENKKPITPTIKPNKNNEHLGVRR